MGGGKGQTSTTVEMTPEQKAQIALQTDALKNTFLPAYQKTVGTASDVYNQVAPAATAAASNASNVAGATGALQGALGAGALATGVSGLESLYNPNYEKNQINAALQAGQESGRELVNKQVADYGSSGQLGSARAALASENLAGLQTQRQATAAAGAQAQVQANKAAAAQQLASIGQSGLTAANQAATSQVGLASVPQDVMSKYASIVYGVPQASTVSNFAGTQGQTQSSKGFGF